MQLLSDLYILLHTKRMPEFCKLTSKLLSALLSFVGYFDVFPYPSAYIKDSNSCQRLICQNSYRSVTKLILKRKCAK